MMHLVVEGNTPSQKNNKNIAFNKRTGRSFIVSNPRVVAWHKSARTQLLEQSEGNSIDPSHYPIAVTAIFYRETRRKYDLDNAYGTVADALVHAGIIEDDNMGCIGTITLQHGGHDKENPRVEIYLDD